MEAASGQPPTYVLTLDAVKWSISELKREKIHTFFLAYLHLRKRAAEEGTTSDIHPRWDELGEHLAVRGGPPGKPYYRPVWQGQTRDESRYWFNSNIAGSYAPSSLRRRPYNVIDTAGSTFSLKPNHAQLAQQYLLYGRRVSAVAFAAFYLRDFGFVAGASGEPDPLDLAGMLATEFHFAPDNEDFDRLFTLDVPSEVSTWFEILDDETAGVE